MSNPKFTAQYIQQEKSRAYAFINKQQATMYCDALQSEIDRLTTRVKELEDANRWIPVSESLPKIEEGRLCTYEIEVAYRYIDMDQREYYRKVTRFWKDRGFEYGYVGGKSMLFEDMFFTVDYYRYLPELPTMRENLPMPDVPQEGEG